jgi:4-alpha-glucanotransferase
VGIVHDLAVGVDPGGADAWALQAELATGVRVGAPPDGFNQQGQDWGLPPLRPDRLLATGLRPLRDMLRSVLAHAGGIRIDHALGLFRLFWIPEGVGAEEGTYVRYPAEAMLAVLALEAERAGAVVIGEDLGTVEEGVHERLRDAGVLGSRVLYFEWEHGRRKPAAHYEREALASVTTHDLPTALGWWRGEGVRLRVDLDLLGPGNDERSERARLDAERAAMLDLLADEGLLTADPGEREIVEAMHAFLARTPSLLVAASPADAIGDPRQPNLPGTVDEYPNWRLPLAIDDGDGPAVVDLDDLLDHPRTRALARALRR